MQTGAFAGRSAYEDALRAALLQACAQGSREIYCVDACFVDWPLSEAPVLHALSEWAARPRRLHLLALQYDELRRRHPRFVQWRTRFDHCIEARAYEAGSGDQKGPVAALFVSGGEQLVSLRLFDTVHWRGAVSLDAADALRTREWFDALAQRSAESFAATTLGL